MSKHEALLIAVLLVGLLLTGCSDAWPKATSQDVAVSEPVQDAARAPIGLTILHTNDNWGETEPCG